MNELTQYAYPQKTWMQLAMQFPNEPNETTIEFQYPNGISLATFKETLGTIRANALRQLLPSLPKTKKESMRLKCEVFWQSSHDSTLHKLIDALTLVVPYSHPMI